MRSLVKRAPLISFFALTLLLGWGAWSILWAQASPSPTDLRSPDLSPGVVFYVAAASPSIAGIAVAWIAGGTEGLRRTVRTALSLRARPRWHLLVLVALPGFGLVSHALAAALTGDPEAWFDPADPGALYMWFPTFLVLLFYGPVSEELFGWRGFALPMMLGRRGDLSVSVVIGCVWQLWYISPYQWPAALEAGPLMLLGFVQPVLLSVVMTWVYRNSGSALLAGVGVHLAVNSVGLYQGTSAALLDVLVAVLAVGIVARYGPGRFTRKQDAPTE